MGTSYDSLCEMINMKLKKIGRPVLSVLLVLGFFPVIYTMIKCRWFKYCCWKKQDSWKT